MCTNYWNIVIFTFFTDFYKIRKMILASAKSGCISITGDVWGVWKTENFSRLCLEEPFWAREDPDCFFTVLFPAIFKRSGDTGLNRTEVVDNSFSNRNFCDCFGETVFLIGSGDLQNGEVLLRRFVDVDFEGLDNGTGFFFSEHRGEISCSLLLHIQLVWVALVRVIGRMLCFLVLGGIVFVDFLIFSWLNLLLRTCKSNSLWK